MCFRKMEGTPFGNARVLPKVYLNSSLKHQPLLLKRAPMPPSKDPFSANIHPNILQFSVHIPQGMCFRKIERAPFENASVGATNPFEITVRTPYSKGPFSTNIFCCAYTSGHVLSENGRGPFENAWVEAKIHLKSPLAPHPAPMKLTSMSHSKGLFSANIHPIIPKFFVPIPQGMCYRQMVGNPLRKWTLRGQKSTSNHRKESGRLLTNLLKVHFPEVISPRICTWSFPNSLCV